MDDAAHVPAREASVGELLKRMRQVFNLIQREFMRRAAVYRPRFLGNRIEPYATLAEG